MDSLQKDLQTCSLKKSTNFKENTVLPSDFEWEDYNQLMRAIQCGQEGVAKSLILNGARVNRDPDYFAYRNNYFPFDINTPLHLVINLGFIEIVKLLLTKRASISIGNNNHETPLITAAKMGNHAIIDLLLSAFDPKDYEKCCPNRENITPMHVACMKNQVDIVKKFLQHGVSINHAVELESLHWPGYTPLHFAVHFQCVETVRFLVSSGADITARATNQLTPLHLAHMIRNETIIDIILSAHEYEVTNPVNLEGLSHFHIACTRNKPAIVKIFLLQMVDVSGQVSENSFNWPGYSAINFAIQYECIDVIKLLLLQHAKLRILTCKSSQYNACNNPIHQAYKTSNKAIIDLLLSKSTIINTNEIARLSEIHTLCVHNLLRMYIKPERVDEIFLKKLRDNINLPIWAGCTPLHVAIKQNCEEMRDMLLKHGASITMKNARGKTPLHLAFDSKQMDTVDLILAEYCQGSENPVDSTGLSHFHISCTRKQSKLVEDFIENGVDINSSVDFNSTF